MDIDNRIDEATIRKTVVRGFKVNVDKSCMEYEKMLTYNINNLVKVGEFEDKPDTLNNGHVIHSVINHPDYGEVSIYLKNDGDEKMSSIYLEKDSKYLSPILRESFIDIICNIFEDLIPWTLRFKDGDVIKSVDFDVLL